MKALKLLAILLGLSLMFCVGCGDDDDGKDTNGVDSNGGDSDTTPVTRQTALSLDFEDGQGAGDKFYVSVPALDDADISDCTVVEQAEGDTDGEDTDAGCVLTHYADNNTATEIAGHNALTVHVDAYKRYSDNDGPSVEVQFALDNPPVDMSSETYTASFDIYIPKTVDGKDLEELQCKPQFAFFSADYTPIYSTVFENVTFDSWNSFSGAVKATGGAINFSKFVNNPGDWQLDYFRVQVMCSGDEAVDDTELLFYLDNVKVSNVI